MPTKAELERKLAALRQQLQEKEHTEQELQEQLAQQQIQLEETRRERDDALEAVQQYEAALSDMSREIDSRVLQEVEHVRQEMLAAHQREVQTQADLIGMLKDKLVMYADSPIAGVGRNDDPHSLHDIFNGCTRGVSVATDVDSEASYDTTQYHKPIPAPRTLKEVKPTPAPRKASLRSGMQLPPLPMFGDAEGEDGDALRRWVKKLHRYAEMQHWTARETLLQFELHLTGKAKFLYDVLSAEVKVNLDSAVDALCERLQPIQHAALASAQLIRRKQGAEESVDAYAQGFEQLFAKSYGNRTGMDSTSKCLLKRDLFTQGLLRKWQEKISSSADTFHDVLFQARAAEEQENTLLELHGPVLLKHTSAPPRRSIRPPDTDRTQQNAYRPSWPQQQGACFSCGKL